MKIYASSTSSDRLIDFAGKDIWVRVKPALQDYSNKHGIFIRVLYVDDRGRLTYNCVPGYFVDGGSKISAKAMGTILNDIYHKYPEDFYIMKPLDTMSTDEIMKSIESSLR